MMSSLDKDMLMIKTPVALSDLFLIVSERQHEIREFMEGHFFDYKRPVSLKNVLNACNTLEQYLEESAAFQQEANRIARDKSCRLSLEDTLLIEAANTALPQQMKKNRVLLDVLQDVIVSGLTP